MIQVARKPPGVTLWDNLAVLPVESDINDVSDGAAFEADSSTHAKQGLVEIWRSTGSGDSTITQPLKVWGWDGTRWYWLATLTTTNLTVSDVRGASFPVSFIGLYARLALTAGNSAPTAGSLSARYVPVHESGS